MIQPLIPSHLKWIALALGGGLFAAGQFAPEPYNLACAGLGSVALFLAGMGWRLPGWAAGRPMLPVALVPIALGAHELLSRYSHLLPDVYQPYAVALAGGLALLGGVLAPEPLKIEGSNASPNPDGTVTTQVAATCSLADVAQGRCKP